MFRILKKIIPRQLYQPLKNRYITRKIHKRETKTAGVPRIMLIDTHIHRLRIITDRVKLLELLPKHGIVAEVGVFRGEYSELILKWSNPEKLYLIDLWEADKHEKHVVQKFGNQLIYKKVEIMRGSSLEQI